MRKQTMPKSGRLRRASRMAAAVVATVILCCLSGAARADTCFTDLGGYSTYDEWKAAQNTAKSTVGVGVAESFEPGGWQTAVATTYIAIEARVKTWLESAGTALRSDVLRGLIIMFK